MTTVWLAGLRDRAEVEAAHRAALEAEPHLREHPIIRGLAAGYAWLLGLSEASPAWDRPGSPTSLDQVRAEAKAAEAARWGWKSVSKRNTVQELVTDPPPDLDRLYADGVKDALTWSIGQLLGPAPWPRPRMFLRAPDELAAARKAVVEELADEPSRRTAQFCEGALVAFDWLLGSASAAPISETPGRPGPAVDVITREEQLADDAIYNRKDAALVPQAWAVGLQHALMWAHHASPNPPVEFGED